MSEGPYREAAGPVNVRLRPPWWVRLRRLWCYLTLGHIATFRIHDARPPVTTGGRQYPDDLGHWGECYACGEYLGPCPFCPPESP